MKKIHSSWVFNLLRVSLVMISLNTAGLWGDFSMAEAALVKVDFEGNVSFIDSFLQSDFNDTQKITGHYIYDPSTELNVSHNGTNRYTNAIKSLVFNIGTNRYTNAIKSLVFNIGAFTGTLTNQPIIPFEPALNEISITHGGSSGSPSIYSVQASVNGNREIIQNIRPQDYARCKTF